MILNILVIAFLAVVLFVFIAGFAAILEILMLTVIGDEDVTDFSRHDNNDSRTSN